MSTTAFIGLGIMGAPMSEQLMKAGHTVIGFSRSREPVDRLVAAGGSGAGSVAEAGFTPMRRKGQSTLTCPP